MPAGLAPQFIVLLTWLVKNSSRIRFDCRDTVSDKHRTLASLKQLVIYGEMFYEK